MVCGILEPMIMENKTDNYLYWQNRASGYSEVNKEELEGVQRTNWASFLTKLISERFPDKEPSQIKILDVGAGPGFISIILAEAGYEVTAFDFSQAMLMEARANAGVLADKINFRQGDAMSPSFEKESFDVVFSRNLTWNLTQPEEAYRQWISLLRPQGMMLVFDANWYSYLVDENKLEEYNQDRLNVAEQGLGDYNIGSDFDKMEAIAMDLPMTRQNRPAWDVRFLQELALGDVEAIEDIGSVLYSEKEKINYKSTPMFMVEFIKV